MAKSRAAAEKALALDPNLAEAHISIALVKMYSDFDWEGAEAEFRRALELNPGSGYAHMTLGFELAYRGHLAEARASFERALELDPIGVNMNNWRVDLGRVFALMVDDEKARAYWARTLQFSRDSFAPHSLLGTHDCLGGRFDEGIAHLEKARMISSDDAFPVADLGYCYAMAGRPEEARAALAQIRERSEREYVDPVAQAIVLVGLGDDDAALAQLHRGVELRAHAIHSVGIDRRFAELRKDPRMQEILRLIGLGSG